MDKNSVNVGKVHSSSDDVLSPQPPEQGTSAHVNEILCGELGVDESDLTPSARLAEDLNADWIDRMHLFAILEEECDITIPESHARQIKTVGDLHAYIKHRA